MENFDLSASTIDFIEGLYYPKHNFNTYNHAHYK